MTARAVHPATAATARHMSPALVQLLGVLGYGRVYTRALDVWLWDHEGREYLDFLAGFGSINLGHNHPRLVARLGQAMGESLVHVMHVGPPVHAAELAEAISRRLPPPLERVLFSSTGAEAIDAALKLARAATRRSAFIYCEGGFHGTSLSALSVMGAERMRKPFEPLLEDCFRIPFGDLAALEEVLRAKRVAAFVVEPIQAEAGVVLPPVSYLREARALCAKYGALLVLDEVQTGLGRVGRPFAFGADEIPDILVLGKSLGGGMLPISATVTSAEIHRRAYGAIDRFDLHGATFSGNALSSIAAIETLRILDDERLSENAAARGEALVTGLRRVLEGHPFVREVRGLGLLVGVALGPTDRTLLGRLTPDLVGIVSKRVFGQWLALVLLERGIVCQPAAHNWDVLKLEPPLTVSQEHIARAVSAVGDALDAYRNLGTWLRDVARRLGRQAKEGWRF